jgi:hypothetical protein
MPLLNVCTVTGNNIVVQVAIIFLSGETKNDYNWAIGYLRGTMLQHSIEEPSSIVTDRELALIQALKARFTSSQLILCHWHININVLDKTKR